MLKVEHIVLSMCQTNCYFLHRDGEAETILVDPADQGERIFEELNKRGLKLAGILLTHGHFDHIWGLEGLLKKLTEAGENVEVYANAEEKELLGDSSMNVSAAAGRPCNVSADVYLKDGEEIALGGMRCRMIATPGHTAGGGCYYFEEDGILLSGDTLFCESVGRTDFPTGSMSELIRSIKEKLFCLPEETVVFPGHGESTTIGHEMKYNPYFG